MVGLLAPITGAKLSPMGGVFWVWILPSKWRSRPSCWGDMLHQEIKWHWKSYLTFNGDLECVTTVPWIWSPGKKVLDGLSMFTSNVVDPEDIIKSNPCYFDKRQTQTSRLICHVWFWPYTVRQSTKLSLYMAYQSTNKCWASVPPQYHPSGPWGSLDKSQTWFTERKPVKKSRQTTNKIFAKKEYFLTLQEKFYYSVHMWAGTL